jgi:hypothetical protein
MHAIIAQEPSISGHRRTAQRDGDGKRLPSRFALRLLLSLPLMALAAFCLFGFVDSFEAMPRVEQWIRRALCVGAGSGSLIAICWVWLRSRPATAAEGGVQCQRGA